MNEKKAKGIVDIVFLMDMTGSMQHCIDALKENIGTFVDTMINNPQSPIKDWRAKVFGYRDVKVDDEPFVDNPFVQNDVAALKAQLAKAKAEGGGDEPESLLDALYLVGNMDETPKGSQSLDPHKWRYRSDAARVVVIFSDASFHPTMSIPEAKGGEIDDIITLMHSERIILSIFAPEFECYDVLAETDKSELNTICGADEDIGAKMKQFTGDVANFQRTLEQLAKSVSKSAAVETL